MSRLTGLCFAAALGQVLAECEGETCAAPAQEHVLLQHRSLQADMKKSCTGHEQDPWDSGSFMECCEGHKSKLGQWINAAWTYKCLRVDPPKEVCTGHAEDPWSTGDHLECCNGLEKKLAQWADSVWSYQCRGAADAVPVTAPVKAPSNSVPGGATLTTILEWNVYYENRDMNGLAHIMKGRNPDIVGICELTAPMQAMASALTTAFGRRFEVQPGRGSWMGYGTDIFYDAEKWEHLDGGVARASCPSVGGPRAANWVVLKERSSGQIIITGGLHTSYCAQGCDELHFCELNFMYDRFQAMKHKYDNAPVVWMGDINRNIYDNVMRSVFNGNLGGKQQWVGDDLVRTRENTYYNGGMAIDHIIGERGAFRIKSGGRTGEGVKGQLLAGADHFPIYADLEILKQ